MLTDQERELFAPLRWEQFGITQAANAICRVENNGGSDDRTEQRSATDFIDSGNVFRACGPCALFKVERTAQFFQQA